MIKFPTPLQHGALVGVTAPSSGVPQPLHARLDLALESLRSHGFRVVEGECLREDWKHVSASRERRAAELMAFLLDPSITAVMPPWGGELAIDLLPLLDFNALARVEPKWFTGFSDLSTLQLPLLLCSGWASLHGPNLMDLVPAQIDETTAGFWQMLHTGAGETMDQWSAAACQHSPSGDWADAPGSPFNLTANTNCRRLDGSPASISFGGRLIGGCLDTISRLAGTRYGNVAGFASALPAEEHTLLFLETAELPPCEVARALLALKMNGWFHRTAGVLIGRSDGPDARQADDIGHQEALQLALGELGVPVVFDLDIGHRPPQWSLVQGAQARLDFADGRAAITQRLLPL